MEIERKFNLSRREYAILLNNASKKADVYYNKYVAYKEHILRQREGAHGMIYCFKYRINDRERLEFESHSLVVIRRSIQNEKALEAFDILVNKIQSFKNIMTVKTKRVSWFEGGMHITVDRFSNGDILFYEIEFELVEAEDFDDEIISKYVNIEHEDNRNKLTKLITKQNYRNNRMFGRF